VAVALFVTGLLGSLHCVGMCGGFVLALDRPRAFPWRRLGLQAAFHAGKTSTYVCLGAAAGLAGGGLVRASWFHSAQAVLAVVAGSLMLVAGLQIAGAVAAWPVGSLFGPGSPYDRAVRAVSNARGPSGAFAMGALAGLLPCPLVYAFLAAALAAGGLFAAMGTMAILGLASMPALVAVALVGASVSPRLRRRVVVAAGVVVAVLGAVVLVRGLAPSALHVLAGA
jgi:sulfite exporter TauE/SafE